MLICPKLTQTLLFAQFFKIYKSGVSKLISGKCEKQQICFIIRGRSGIFRQLRKMILFYVKECWTVDKIVKLWFFLISIVCLHYRLNYGWCLLYMQYMKTRPQKGQGRYLGKKAIDMLLNMSTTREDNLNKKLLSAGNDDVWMFNSCYKAYTDSRQK